MLMNDTVFMRAQDRKVRTDLEGHIGNRVARRALFDETNDCGIVDVFVGSEIDQLIAGPLAHLVPGMDEVALPYGPLDRMGCLNDIEHVDRRVKDSLQIECVLDNAFGVRGEIRSDKDLRYFLQADLARVRLSGGYR